MYTINLQVCIIDGYGLVTFSPISPQCLATCKHESTCTFVSQNKPPSDPLDGLVTWIQIIFMCVHVITFYRENVHVYSDNVFYMYRVLPRIT